MARLGPRARCFGSLIVALDSAQEVESRAAAPKVVLILLFRKMTICGHMPFKYRFWLIFSPSIGIYELD